MEKAKRARKAETPKQPSPCLRLRAPYLYPDHEYWRRVFHFSPFTVWFNLTGQPAIVLPLARCDATSERTVTGFPISVQLVARYGDEATLFRLAAQLEKEAPWKDRRPQVWG